MNQTLPVLGVALLLGAANCSNTEGVDLRVRLITDYQPLFDFVTMRTTVSGAPSSSQSVADLDLRYSKPGEEITEFFDLPPVQRREVVVTLFDAAGDVVDDSTVVIEHLKTSILTIAISRSCGDIKCSPGERCLGNTCVPENCTSGLEDSCPDKFDCTTDTDCASGADCAIIECVDFVCTARPNNEVCESGQVCDVGRGCVKEPESCQSVTDCKATACETATCVPELGYCHYGFIDNVVCVVGGEQGTCYQGVCSSCGDSQMNQEETDVDCGGPVCGGCEVGKMCGRDRDCVATAVCNLQTSGLCEDVFLCGNGSQEDNGTHREVCDDGDQIDDASCTADCLAGPSCSSDADCTVGVCDDKDSKRCELSNHCGNGKEDASEACDDGNLVAGDGCAPNCKKEDGGSCDDHGDCFNGFCHANICQSTSDLCRTQTEIPTYECAALEAIYDKMGGSGWKSFSGWKMNTNPCNWYGVECDFSGGINHVIRFNLWGNNATGNLATEVIALDQLVALTLGDNSVSGPIPPELGQMTTLTSLYLGINQFSGAIPSELGNLSALTNLSIQDNNLTGSIPQSLGNLTNLTFVLMHDNGLTGSIPEGFSNFTGLTQLQIQNNNLTGPLPASIGNWTRLEYLYAGNNALNGMVPSGVTNFTQFATVSLCPQTGSLTADAATGTWLRNHGVWPADNDC